MKSSYYKYVSTIEFGQALFLVMSQKFFKRQMEKSLGEFMPQAHKTVERWTDFLLSDVVFFGA